MDIRITLDREEIEVALSDYLRSIYEDVLPLSSDPNVEFPGISPSVTKVEVTFRDAHAEKSDSCP